MKKKRERLSAERLDAAMREAGYVGRGSDARLAARLNVAQDQIKRWRDGASSPESPTLQLLAEELGKPMAYFFGRNEPEDPIADVAAILRRLSPEKLGEARGYIKRMATEEGISLPHQGKPPVEGDPGADPAVRRQLEAAARKPAKPPAAPAASGVTGSGSPVRPAPSPDATKRRPR